MKEEIEPRLLTTYDYVLRWLSRPRRGEAPGGEAVDDARGDVIVAWERVGLNGEGLFLHLHQAGLSRMQYESHRRRIAEGKKLGARGRRRALRVLDGADPLIQLLSGQMDGAEGASRTEVLEGLKYLVLRCRQDIVRERKLPRNRPGEPWLADHVILLAEHLRGAGLGWRRTVRLVHAAFKAVGMADVVKSGGIWSILRKAKTRYRDFRLRLKPTTCQWCRSGPTRLGQAIEDVRFVRDRAGQAGIERMMRSPSTKRMLREYREEVGRMLRENAQRDADMLARKGRAGF